MYSYHAFEDAVSNSARGNPVPPPRRWCASEHLTSADLRPSRFTRLISTPRMTAPANCTSACPLTQRPARLLSKVRSGSDFNPFPLLALGLLCHLMTAAFPAHFTWDSRVTRETGDISATTPPQSATLYLIELCSTANKEQKMTLYPRKQTPRRHHSKIKGVKGTARISVLLDELLKVRLSPNLLKGSFNPDPLLLKWQFDLSGG